MPEIPGNITDLIPQRPPFIMIDKVVYCDEKLSRTRFRIKDDNLFVAGNRFSEPGLVENIAQTAAAHAGYISVHQNKPVTLGYIAAVNNLYIHWLPAIDDELETEVTIEHKVFDVTLIKGKVHCRGELVAACDMKIFIQSK